MTRNREVERAPFAERTTSARAAGRPRPLLLACTLVALFAAPARADQDAAVLFAEYRDRVLQVRVIDVEADKKATLGTGFVIGESGLVATNFHVVSLFVDKPGKYRLEYADARGDTGRLRLLDVDVVNDLALVASDELTRAPLELTSAAPSQGDTLYSLGNPHDIGFSVVPGIYNGIDAKSYYEQILFSGSLNPGMSGGPALDARGRVVGVNVSTAGNELSFLVPVHKLVALMDEWRDRDAPVTDFRARMGQQLVANQADLVNRMLERAWPTQALGAATIVGELDPFVKCWGSSSDDDDLHKYVSSTCLGSHQIYLGAYFTTGLVGYQFYWLEANELSGPRFRSYYQALFSNYSPDNYAGEDDVGRFACEERFVRDGAEHVDKVVLCARAYLQYPGLYDFFYLRGSVDETDRAFMSHFTLAGVARDSAKRFLARFQETAHR